jgi:hypothetical protein
MGGIQAWELGGGAKNSPLWKTACYELLHRVWNLDGLDLVGVQEVRWDKGALNQHMIIHSFMEIEVMIRFFHVQGDRISS